MKSLIKYFLLLFFLGSLFSCNNPQPTALVEDTDPFEIEVITKNSAEPTSFGVDSTGLNENPARFTNVISCCRNQTKPFVAFQSNLHLHRLFSSIEQTRLRIEWQIDWDILH